MRYKPMPIRTFLGKFARACRYRTDAANELRRGPVAGTIDQSGN
jgi:hypothetical protein